MEEKGKGKQVSPQTASIGEWFQFFEKTLRAYQTYGENHPAPVDFEKNLHQRLQTVLTTHGPFSVEIKPYDLLFEENNVFHNEEKEGNFIFRLYQDGFRNLSFLPKIEVAEIHRLIRILRTDFESYAFCDDDTATLFWKEDFQHIAHVAVESFSEGRDIDTDLEKTLTQMSLDCIQDSSPSSLASGGSTGPANFSRRLRKADVEEIAKLPNLPTGGAIEGFDGAILQTKNLLGKEDDTILQRILVVLFRVLVTQENGKEFQAVGLVVQRLVHSAIRLTKLSLAARILEKLRELSDPNTNSSRKNAILMNRFYDDFMGPDLMEDLVRAVIAPTFSDIAGFTELAGVLPPKTTRSLFEVVKATSRKEIREAIVPALARSGSAHLDDFSLTLVGADKELALMILQVMESIGAKACSGHLKRAYRHHDPEVRGQVLAIFSRAQLNPGQPFLLESLKDGARDVRLHTLRFLLEERNPSSVKYIADIISDSTFGSRDLEEKRFFCQGLAKLARQKALPFFQQMLKEGLLESDRLSDTKVAAIWGLYTIGTQEAETVVREESGRPRLPDSVQKACEATLGKWEKSRG